jgi:hypothetical protein
MTAPQGNQMGVEKKKKPAMITTLTDNHILQCHNCNDG